jgi:MOSC domain-containing protein YiiM
VELLSVNIGEERDINSKSGKSGIYKQPATGPVRITVNGLPGDVITDVKHHGGVDQAVYVYGQPDYDWWSAELGYALAPGTFGENLTIAGLESMALCIGDRLQVGEVLLEVTAPRVPCVTLATRMGDPQFVKRFKQADRYGPYCRVITPGSVQQGDPVTLIPYTGDRMTITDEAHLFYAKPTEADLRRLLALPVAIRSREDYEQKLAELTAARG